LTIEVGSKDYIKLEDLAKKINSKSKFKGRVDNQIIKSKENYVTSSLDVYKFLNNIKC